VWVRQNLGDVVRKISPLLHISCFSCKVEWPRAGFKVVQATSKDGRGAKIVKGSTPMRAQGMGSFILRKRHFPTLVLSSRPCYKLSSFFFSHDEMAKHAINLSFICGLRLYFAASKTCKCIQFSAKQNEFADTWRSIIEWVSSMWGVLKYCWPFESKKLTKLCYKNWALYRREHTVTIDLESLLNF
jgi:hypothetical protein